MVTTIPNNIRDFLFNRFSIGTGILTIGSGMPVLVKVLVHKALWGAFGVLIYI